jgi:hypothetical protein
MLGKREMSEEHMSIGQGAVRPSSRYAAAQSKQFELVAVPATTSLRHSETGVSEFRFCTPHVVHSRIVESDNRHLLRPIRQPAAIKNAAVRYQIAR